MLRRSDVPTDCSKWCTMWSTCTEWCGDVPRDLSCTKCCTKWSKVYQVMYQVVWEGPSCLDMYQVGWHIARFLSRTKWAGDVPSGLRWRYHLVVPSTVRSGQRCIKWWRDVQSCLICTKWCTKWSELYQIVWSCTKCPEIHPVIYQVLWAVPNGPMIYQWDEQSDVQAVWTKWCP